VPRLTPVRREAVRMPTPSQSAAVDPAAVDSGDQEVLDGSKGKTGTGFTPPPPPPFQAAGKVKLMDGERTIFTEETNPQLPETGRQRRG
jgi:hypothetical protein